MQDLAEVLGRIGERDGITAGIAQILLEKCEDIERVFREHDAMLEAREARAASEHGTSRDAKARSENISVFPSHG